MSKKTNNSKSSKSSKSALSTKAANSNSKKPAVKAEPVKPTKRVEPETKPVVAKPAPVKPSKGDAVAPNSAKLRALAQEIASRPAAPSTPMLQRSTIENPVALVWAICDQNAQSKTPMRRCDIIRFLVGQGVATYTARTQYQRWYTKRREETATAR